MRVRVLVGREAQCYYQRLPGAGVLRWYLEGEGWVSVPDTLPDDTHEVPLDKLPPPLQEELLATAIRTQAMGQHLWAGRN